ncbi:hypothetical protein LTR85_009698 [Meristemomyces frigidus]|nr:hypothetical protein LTR85_009698 [Meristemomyces frigidus]
MSGIIDPILDPEGDYRNSPDYEDSPQAQHNGPPTQDAAAAAQSSKRSRFDPTGAHRAEIESRTLAGETCTQIAAALTAKGVPTTQATIARRRLKWGLRQRDQRIFVPERSETVPPEQRVLVGNQAWRKEEIVRLTGEGQSAEEIAEVLEGRGVVLKKGASTVWRLQTLWGLVERDEERTKGRGKWKKKKEGVEGAKRRGGSGLRKVEREAAAERRRAWEAAGKPRRTRMGGVLVLGGTGGGGAQDLQHYPQDCLFGPSPKRGRVEGAVEYEVPGQFDEDDTTTGAGLGDQRDPSGHAHDNGDDVPIQIDLDLDSDSDGGTPFQFPDHDTPDQQQPLQQPPPTATNVHSRRPHAPSNIPQPAHPPAPSHQMNTSLHNQQPSRSAREKITTTTTQQSARPSGGRPSLTTPPNRTPLPGQRALPQTAPTARPQPGGHHPQQQTRPLPYPSAVQTADIMSAEILVDLTRSAFVAASELKDILLAAQLQKPAPGSMSALPPSAEDLATARRKVVEAARCVVELASGE